MRDLINTTPLTMSSRDIADLVEKEHRNVMRDARKMLAELHGEGGVLRFEHTLPDPQNGQPYPILRLPKRETLVLIAGYSVTLRARIIDRWEQLEAGAAATPAAAALNLRDPKHLAAAAAQLLELNQELQAQVTTMQITVAAHHRLARADGAVCITNAAKDLQLRPKDLFAWLKAHQWIYRRQGGTGWLAYQDRIQQGLLEHKVTTVERSDGTEKVVEQVLVTPKGLARLAEQMTARQAA